MTTTRAMAERLEDGMGPEEAKIADALGDVLVDDDSVRWGPIDVVDVGPVAVLVVAGKLVARDEDGNEYDVAIVVTRRS
jgi:hypothetical protein